ncbi:MAG: T9SS type A sorting domain-containing protein, partial [Bacteroidales bacterium]|nr:T9SS type A sorting domain-containing protein [Bacteroidales bacterium]
TPEIPEAPEVTEVTGTTGTTKGNTHFSVTNNPVAGETSFIVKGLKGQRAEISIINTVGKTVATAFKGALANDKDVILWNSHPLAKGIYLATLKTNGVVESIKLVVR